MGCGWCLPYWTARSLIGFDSLLRAMGRGARRAGFPSQEIPMTTSCQRAFVSIAATMTITLALGACMGASTRPVLNARMSIDALPLTIRFDNLASERVDVYLIGAKREWLLGRVEA